MVQFILTYCTLFCLLTVLEITSFRSLNRSSKVLSRFCSPSYLTSPCSRFWIRFSKSVHNLPNIHTKKTSELLVLLWSGHYDFFCVFSHYIKSPLPSTKLNNMYVYTYLFLLLKVKNYLRVNDVNSHWFKNVG